MLKPNGGQQSNTNILRSEKATYKKLEKRGVTITRRVISIKINKKNRLKGFIAQKNIRLFPY